MDKAPIDWVVVGIYAGSFTIAGLAIWGIVALFLYAL